MKLDDDNDGESLDKIIEDELLREPDPDDDGAPRDSCLLRLAKFAAIIIGPALLIGALFAIGDYFTSVTSNSNRERSIAERNIAHDSGKDLKNRFIIGAIIGGALGSIYVCRCLIKRVDP